MANIRPLQPGDPQRLGVYELVGRLGEGAQGVVYLARPASDTSEATSEPEGAEKQVAIKLLRADLAADATARTRLVREVNAAKRVADFTARVLDADVAGDHPYIVSEYVEGPSLQRLVAEDGPRTGGALTWLAIATATALNAIHRAGIVHRDLKPHNVLVSRDGPRVIDFGIARALDTTSTITTGVVGTPAYMAPEALDNAEVTAKADIFAWGATITYAATGQPPFGSDSLSGVVSRILHHDPDLGSLPESLRELVAACLAKRPEERPTARHILQHLLGHEDTPPAAVPAAGLGAGTGEQPYGSGPSGETGVEGAPPAAAAVPGPPQAETAGVPQPGTAGTAPVTGAAGQSPSEATGTSSMEAAGSTRTDGRRRSRVLLLTGVGTLLVVLLGALVVTPRWLDRSRSTTPPPAAPPVAESFPPEKPDTPRPRGLLSVRGCSVGAEGSTCLIRVRAVGGAVRWQVRATSENVRASGSGTLRGDRSGTVAATIVRPDPCEPGSGLVSFRPGGRAAVSWTCPAPESISPSG